MKWKMKRFMIVYIVKLHSLMINFGSDSMICSCIGGTTCPCTKCYLLVSILNSHVDERDKPSSCQTLMKNE